MRREIIVSSIIALGLVVSGFLVGGRYSLIPVTTGSSAVVARLDRLTGAVETCVLVGVFDSCDWVRDVAREKMPTTLSDEQMHALESAGIVRPNSN